MRTSRTQPPYGMARLFGIATPLQALLRYPCDLITPVPEIPLVRPTNAQASRPFVFGLASLLLLLFGLQLVHVARLYSANWDEAHHLLDGYRIWHLRDYRLNAEVPPLIKLAAAAAILPLHPALPPTPDHFDLADAFRDGRTFLVTNGVAPYLPDRLLLPARLACTVFTLLLALAVFLAGRALFSPAAGIAALALLVFDPLLLAHGTLVSTDVGSALFLFTTTLAFFAYVRRPSPVRLLLTGLLAGLALVAKFTGIFIVPLLLLLAVAESLRRRSLSSLARLLAAAVAALFVGYLVLWLFYGFRFLPARNGLALSPPLAPYLSSLPNPAQGEKLALLARFHLLPQAYIWGLANTKHTEFQYVSYFFGHIYRHGPWQYFPVAFLIKSTLPFLLLLLLVPFLRYHLRRTTLAPRAAAPGSERSSPTPPSLQQLIFLLLPVLLYFGVVTSSHFEIGARHLMPVYPFLYVLAGWALATLFEVGRPWAVLGTVLLLWQVVTSVRVAPAYMAYGNEAMGGPLAVRRYLSDANVDWGQQLKTVHTYLAQNHITNCWFAYFPDAAIQPEDYDVHCHRLPTPSALWWLNLPMQVPPTIDGTILISESDFDGVETGEGALNPYDSFHAVRPVAILEDGVFVFQGRFPVPLASAWVATRDSAALAGAGKLDPALALAQQAVALAPNSAHVQLNLADILAKQSRWPEALAHYQAAEQALVSNRPDLEAEEFDGPIRAGLVQAQTHVALSPARQ